MLCKPEAVVVCMADGANQFGRRSIHQEAGPMGTAMDPLRTGPQSTGAGEITAVVVFVMSATSESVRTGGIA